MAPAGFIEGQGATQITSVAESPALQAAEAAAAAAQGKVTEASRMASTFKASDLTWRAMALREDLTTALAELEQAQAKAAEVRDVVVEAIQAADLPVLQDLVGRLSESLAAAELINQEIVEYQAETVRRTGGRAQASGSFGAVEPTDLVMYWRQTQRANGYLVD